MESLVAFIDGVAYPENILHHGLLIAISIGVVFLIGIVFGEGLMTKIIDKFL